MRTKVLTVISSAIFLLVPSARAQTPIRALIIDGQNNHAWRQTTPVLKKILEETGLFQVDVLTSPAADADFSNFKPEFSKYRVVVTNYNDCTSQEIPPDKFSVGCPGTGDQWPAEVKSALEKYVRQGGGFVVFHAANNAFANWPEYNRMIGVGGWGNRDEKAGPYWYYKSGKLVSDRSPGRTGNHGARTPYLITIQDPEHPITKGLPKLWMHATDELYDSLRGPGENMSVLATAHSDPANRGTGRDEPMLMAITYGKGRVFHTALGNDIEAMRCVGFITTFQRGTEWAATGKVTMKVPADFPSSEKVSLKPSHLTAEK